MGKVPVLDAHPAAPAVSSPLRSAVTEALYWATLPIGLFAALLAFKVMEDEDGRE